MRVLLGIILGLAIALVVPVFSSSMATAGPPGVVISGDNRDARLSPGEAGRSEPTASIVQALDGRPVGALRRWPARRVLASMGSLPLINLAGAALREAERRS